MLINLNVHEIFVKETPQAYQVKKRNQRNSKITTVYNIETSGKQLKSYLVILIKSSNGDIL